MVIDETHGFAGIEGIEGTKNGRMAESFGNAACVKGIDGVGRVWTWFMVMERWFALKIHIK